ncbi:MAG: iron chaperone [Erysipelotrichaceae bacterium]
MSEKFNTIEEYYNSLTENKKIVFDELRLLFFAEIPNCVEKFSWSMPTYNNGNNIIHFYFHKNHLGIYPGSDAINNFESQLTLKKFKYSKGAFQIPYECDIPYDLLKKMIRYNLKNS